MKKKENYSILRDPVVKFFRGNNFAFLGTLNKDGSPQVTPTWIDIAEDEGQELILINTAGEVHATHDGFARTSESIYRLLDTGV